MQSFVDEYVFFFHFIQKFKMTDNNGRKKNDFGGKWPVYSADTLWVKNFVKIPQSRTISEINVCLPFTQKFKMATKNSFKIALSRTVSEILKIFHFQHLVNH